MRAFRTRKAGMKISLEMIIILVAMAVFGFFIIYIIRNKVLDLLS